MARKKKEESPFLTQAREDVKSLAGIDRTIVDPLLVNLSKLYDYLDALTADIDQDGPMIEKEVGTVNNRHIEMVENPALTTYTKTVGRAGGLARQISAFTKNATVPEEEDEFEAFNAE